MAEAVSPAIGTCRRSRTGDCDTPRRDATIATLDAKLATAAAADGIVNRTD
jgi:hypothetical protein